MASHLQQERKAETSRRLIEGAIESLLENGYAGAGVQDICRRAGVTGGAIQHNFGSKQGLMTAVVDELFRRFIPESPPSGPLKAPLSDRLDRLVDHYWRIYSDDRYYAVFEILLATRQDNELMRLVADHRRQLLADLSEFLTIEFADVALSAERLSEVAQEMIDYLRGYSIHRLYTREDRLDEAARQRARQMLESAFVPGKRADLRTVK